MRQKTKDISPIQYAKWLGLKGPQYIHRLLKNEQFDKLPHVISVKRYSRFYTLEVPEHINAESFKLITRKNATKVQK